MTNALWFRRWFPVAVGVVVTIGLWTFGFFPYHQRAKDNVQKIRGLEQQLQTKLALLQHVPTKKKELDSLLAYLKHFRADLFRTDQVDQMMHAMEERAREAQVRFWTLNPSVPVLITLDDAKDSIAALQLAVLPVEFECHGDYVAVGKFLESEERRSEFAAWESLTISPKDRTGGVRANGAATMYLLPEKNFEGGTS